MSKNKILVPLDKKSYEVFIESGLLDDIGNHLINLGIKNTRKILIISNNEIFFPLATGKIKKAKVKAKPR